MNLRRVPKLIVNCSGLRGVLAYFDATDDCSGLVGDCSGLTGDCSGLVGICSGLVGDLDDCNFTDKTDIATLVK